MLNKVKDFILRHHLLDEQQRYLIAVSGGADSVALLRVMQLLGYQIEACHCNFRLRGDESDRDEQFVVQLCLQLGIELHRIHFDTIAFADLHKVSIEMAARELRYQYFEQLCEDIGAQAVCVAHHGDDNAETVLLNLLRGTGIHGLCGIKPYRPIRESSKIGIVRPLLCITRAEIETWLKSIHQDFVTDSTNLKDDVTRNQIRLNVLPLLQKMVPTITHNLQETAFLMTEAERCYHAYVDTKLPHNEIKISELKETASAISVLYEWLSRYGFSPSTIRQICQHLDAPTGRYWSSETHHICIDRGRLLLTPIPTEKVFMRMPETGLYNICSHDEENNGRQQQMKVSLCDGAHFERTERQAFLDADKATFPLTLRNVHQGDRFIPFGMTGSRLVSDFMTDLKIPITEKLTQQVVTDAQGAIIWIVGRRIANPYRITSNTQKTLILEIID